MIGCEENNMKHLCLLLSLLSCFALANDHRRLVEYPASDKLLVVADHYFRQPGAPMIILFHQPQSSRGEFRYIAEHLYEIGYQVLAVDLRSGDFAHGKTNLTHMAARKGKYERRYADSYLDFEATLAYVQKSFGDIPTYVLASSFNSILAMKLVVEHPNEVDALMLLSPKKPLVCRIVVWCNSNCRTPNRCCTTMSRSL